MPGRIVAEHPTQDTPPTEQALDDAQAMACALDLARQAMAAGEVPVGAVVLDARGRVVGTGQNRTRRDQDPTAHAEMIALRMAARAMGNHRLPGARLLVTLEPCAMCLGAAFHARLSEILYAAADPKTGACGGALDLASDTRINHHAHVHGGLLAEPASQLLRTFFQSRRHPSRPAACPASTGADAPQSPPVSAHGGAEGIYLISPSGRVQDAATLDRAVERLRQLGFHVSVDPAALAGYQRFAGSDAQRLAAIGRALCQPHPLVMSTRGGYGLSRLLPAIDWHAVADSGKRFVGYSDFTAFSLGLLAQTGAESLAGPAAVPDFGAETLDDLTPDLFCELVRGELEILSFEAPDADDVDTRGILWGGNLAMLASLAGTPYLPRIQAGILFLEDVGEHPFRIERMLNQLWQAGVLARQRAIVLGRFTEYRLAAHDAGYDLAAVVRWLRETVRVPVITGLPFGHVPTKATLPVGRHVGLATEAGMAYLVLSDHAH